jgi:ssDNA-binding Zn-finger/Zn-ribbon topoisomerase 1
MTTLPVGAVRGTTKSLYDYADCQNNDCDYTTANQPEHDPEPSPEPETTVERDGMGEYRLSTVEKWHLPAGASPDAVKYGTLMVDAGMIDASRHTASDIHAEDQAAIDQRNLDIAEARTKPEQACSDCGGEMVRRRIRGTEMSVPFCEQCQCPTKPAWPCPQCGESVLKANIYPGRIACGCGFEATTGVRELAACNEDAADATAWHNAFVGCGLAACDEMDRVRPGLTVRINRADAAKVAKLKPSIGHIVHYPGPGPEAEVTELERLRVLVKALEHEAQGLRDESAESEQRRAIARGQTSEWKQRYMAERAARLDAGLELVAALADLQALREHHGTALRLLDDHRLRPETGPQPERAESRLADVPGFVFERGPRITCSEDD